MAHTPHRSSSATWGFTPTSLRSPMPKVARARVRSEWHGRGGGGAGLRRGMRVSLHGPCQAAPSCRAWCGAKHLLRCMVVLSTDQFCVGFLYCFDRCPSSPSAFRKQLTCLVPVLQRHLRFEHDLRCAARSRRRRGCIEGRFFRQVAEQRSAGCRRQPVAL